jgi:hypothetical protein
MHHLLALAKAREAEVRRMSSRPEARYVEELGRTRHRRRARR